MPMRDQPIDQAADAVVALSTTVGEPLDALYRRHAAWLTGLVRRTLGTLSADAEDLVHDAYVRLGRYTPDDIARHPQALLRLIAINLARDHMRRSVVRGQGVPPDDSDIALRLATPSTQETEVDLKRLILALPARCRDVFVLSRFTRMSNEDIAAHLAISVKTVESRMSKALALCTKHLHS